MNFAVAAVVFALVFPAELPDKTALASVVLATRYRPLPVFAGVAAAFAVHVALAVTAGGLLALLPHRALEVVVAGLFGVGALLLLLRGGGEHGPDPRPADDRPPTALRAITTSFVIIGVAEFGDLTQIVMASMGAKYHHSLLAVAVGSVLALWAVGALAVTGGRGLLRVVPITVIVRLAALAMVTLAVISLVNAVEG
ncbi:MAG TPA: TMEM165/GDT1 family protein [Streptosporangiaceae bacterium]